MTNLGETLVFWICGGLAVVGALGMILSRKAVHSALGRKTQALVKACVFEKLVTPA